MKSKVYFILFLALLDTEELGFFAGCGAFRLQFESVDVIDGQNCGSHKPRQSQK